MKRAILNLRKADATSHAVRSGTCQRPYRSAATLFLACLLSASLVTATAHADSCEPFRSDVMRGGQPPQHIRVNVAGLKEVWLIAFGEPNNRKGYADWGDAKLIVQTPGGFATCTGMLPNGPEQRTGRTHTN